MLMCSLRRREGKKGEIRPFPSLFLPSSAFAMPKTIPLMMPSEGGAQCISDFATHIGKTHTGLIGLCDYRIL